MSMSTEAPALIQYACERCKTRFVLPPSSRRLNPAARISATLTAISRTLRYHEGYSVTYDGVRRQMLAKMDDDAYQSFVQSFKFCHECRQFVCSECWSNSRKTCLGCFAKAAGTTSRQKPPYAPEGPAVPRPIPALAPARNKSRLRTDASLLVMAAAILLLVVEVAIALPGSITGSQPSGTAPVAGVTQTGTPEASPTPSATESPSAVPSDSPSGSPSATPSASDSPSPSPTPSTSPTPTSGTTPTPRITPRPTPKPTPKPTAVTPVIRCNSSAGPLNLAVDEAIYCVAIIPNGATGQWYWSGSLIGTAAAYADQASVSGTVTFKLNGVGSNPVRINVS